MIAFANLSTKGQLVVPAQVRQCLSLKAGDRVAFVLDDNGGVKLERVLTLVERRARWLDEALSTYEEPHVWSAIDGEDFIDPEEVG